jgi:uncharacterized damage-inducible protein DinB
MKHAIRALPVLVLIASAAFAQSATTAPAPSTVSGLKNDVLWQLTDVEKKLVSLAEATPHGKFGWRPADGIRSVSEVYMHVAGGNYFLTSFLGAKMPEGFSRDMEKTVTEKAKVIDAMKKSFAHARKTVEATPDSDLDKKVKFFGQEPSERMMMIVLVSHGHEHLGQAIAYARMNGVAPPWSEGPAPAADKKPTTK